METTSSFDTQNSMLRFLRLSLDTTA